MFVEDFPAGSIIVAIKDFETNNVWSNYHIKKNEILKILKTDEKGDYSINRLHESWEKNSWIFRNDIESKVKLVKVNYFILQTDLFLKKTKYGYIAKS
jgi:hypothetical protein